MTKTTKRQKNVKQVELTVDTKALERLRRAADVTADTAAAVRSAAAVRAAASG